MMKKNRIAVPKLVWAASLSLLLLVAVGCGGGGGTSPSPTPSPTPLPVASGEFLFEGNSLDSLNLSSINLSTGVLSAATPATQQGDDEVIYPGVAVTPSKKFLYALFSS